MIGTFLPGSMVQVIPFKGYRYSNEKVPNMARVVAPPYDVIKGKKVDEIQGLSPYNIAWIDKNKPQEGDGPDRNQYTRAGDLWRAWLAQGVLKRDDNECFYVYCQDFEVEGRTLSRFGFIGLLGQEEFATAPPPSGKFAGILQHEETLPKDIQDRLNLTRATLAQFGQIFVIYPDEKGEVDDILRKYMEKKAPVMDLIDFDNIRQRLWVVDGKKDVKAITKAMKDKYVIVADGHHRYKTSLAMAKEHPELKAAQYTMMCFVNMANPGLVILPTHRLVQNLEFFSKQELMSRLAEHFEVQGFQDKEPMFNAMDGIFKQGKHAFGLFMNDGKFYCLKLKDVTVMDKLLPERSSQLRQLDVSILHVLVLDRLLGIDKAKLAQGTMTGGGYVVYIKGIGDAVDEAIQSVKDGAQACFFMNPTRIGEVGSVATNFECMPQKSTFFHPKVWTGFAIHKLD